MYEERESISCNKELDEIGEFLEELNEYIPHIDWDLQSHDHENGYYVTITVPTSQYKEAEEIMTAYENEELELWDYDPFLRYSGLYEYKNNNYTLHQNVINFVKAASMYRSIVEDLPETKLIDGMNMLIQGLTEIFQKAYLLPDIYEDISITPTFDDPPQGDFVFGDYKTFDMFPEYYIGSKQDIIDISTLVVDIYQDIVHGLTIYEEENEDEYYVAAIWNWRYRFYSKDGWGDNCYKVIGIIREFLRIIQNKRL